MIRIGILGSTRGTNLIPILEAIKQGVLDASVSLVLSNKEDSLILEKANSAGIAHHFLSSKGLSRADYDQQLTDHLMQAQVDVVVLIGYMRILSAEFVQHWEGRIINVHPSLLPAFAGKMDLEVHQAVLDTGQVETGCTVHMVTAEVDAGPILVQKKCPVLPFDTAETLKLRVQSLEGLALVEAIKNIMA